MNCRGNILRVQVEINLSSVKENLFIWSDYFHAGMSNSYQHPVELNENERGYPINV